MANLRKDPNAVDGASPMKQRNLIFSHNENQIVRDKDDPNVIKGYFLDVQLDQSGMTQKDAKAGKADSNPHLTSETYEKDGDSRVGHSTFFSKGQYDAIMAQGQSFTDDKGNTHMAAKANLAIKKDEKTGKSSVIVLTPKEVKEGMTPEEAAKVEAYNEKNPFGPSDTKNFGPKTIEKQDTIKALAKAAKAAAAPQRTAPEAQAEAQAPEAGTDTEFEG